MAFNADGQERSYIFDPSTAQPPGTTATVTVLHVGATTALYGQPITLSATISPEAASSHTPTGSVRFFDGSTNIGSATIRNGVATLTTANLPVGSDALSASYSGDSLFKESTSLTVDVNVRTNGTSIIASSSPNPSAFGQSVTFTAILGAAGSGGGTPTGTVTFMDGSATLTTVALSKSKASYSTATLGVGPHVISVEYEGDSSFAAQTSATFVQNVQATSNATQTLLSISPASTTFGRKVSLTANVTTSSSFSGTPTGAVPFYDGTVVLGTEPVQNFQAALGTANLHPGDNYIEAIYSGDSSFSGSTSQLLDEFVGTVGTRMKVSSSRGTSVQGQYVTFIATVTAVGQGNAVPQGSVSFSDGSKLSKTVVLEAGKASS